MENKMKTLTIAQKPSNSGSIHDISSDCFDREIKFPKGSQFAVVLASYYGGKGYTTHRNEWTAIKKAKEMSDYSLEIIDAEGNTYRIYEDWENTRLVRD